MWRYRWLVLAFVWAAGGLGLLYARTQSPEYVATASVVVQDPRASSLFENPSVFRPERYVADQVEILRSTAVAERTSEIVQEQLPSSGLSVDDFLENVEIASQGDSDLIEIHFRATDPQVARVSADAIAVAYQDVQRSEAANNAAFALGRLDASLNEIELDLGDIQARITALRQGEEFRDDLDGQFSEAIALLVKLQEERSFTTDLERLEEIRADLDGLLQQFRTVQVVRGLEKQDPQLVALLQEQTEAIKRRADLAARRDQIVVDAELASSGVALFSPARLPEQPSNADPVQLAGVFLVLGGLLGTALAYVLALRRRTFTDRSEPELVLGVPLLAEVPFFFEERIKSPLPVRAAPASAAAEAFRFAAAAIDIRVAAMGAKLVVTVSGKLGEGKTTVTANIAIVAAQKGSRVLVIDADFGDQALSRLFLEGKAPGWGLTEVVEAGLELRDAIELVSVAEETYLSLLGRGLLPVTAVNFFGSAVTRSFFDRVREEFDLVLIDAPPLLQVAYASTLVRDADAAVVVVPHRNRVAEVEDVAGRLSLIGTEAVGYVYNWAPLRPEMTASGGSLKAAYGIEAQEPAAKRGRRHRTRSRGRDLDGREA